jgi:hypothetical protein
MEKQIFDYQVFRMLKWSKKQPDLDKVVRLLLTSFPYRPINIRKFLNIFYSKENEALLGNNGKNFEIRLFLYKIHEIPDITIICLAISYQNILGYFQSLLFRFIFYPLLLVSFRTIRKTTQQISS